MPPRRGVALFVAKLIMGTSPRSAERGDFLFPSLGKEIYVQGNMPAAACAASAVASVFAS